MLCTAFYCLVSEKKYFIFSTSRGRGGLDHKVEFPTFFLTLPNFTVYIFLDIFPDVVNVNLYKDDLKCFLSGCDETLSVRDSIQPQNDEDIEFIFRGT